MYQLVKNKAQQYICFTLVVVFYSPFIHASFNPYNKKMVLNIGDNAHWVFSKNEVSRSGQKKIRNNINYYHLRVSPVRLLLRLGQNDPSGNIENSRSLNALDIMDVNVDGQRLSLFQWCMTNRMGQIDKKAFRQGTVVKNNTCSNTNGDFAIKLDKETRQLLVQSKSIQFKLMPHDSVESISFSLNGLSEQLAKINPPVKTLATVKKSPAVKVPAKPVVAVKPAANKNTPARKVNRTCYSKPPSAYKTKIKVISYPCGSSVKQADAKKQIQQQLRDEKQREDALLKQQKQLRAEEQARKKAQTEIAHRSEKWESEQNGVWIARCKVRWDRGVSPCFCRRVFDQAPLGTVDTCKK